MNGLSIPNTPIVVDYWNLKDVHSRSLFFLSHMHADHTSGLSELWNHPIYCTPVTGKLLRHKFNIKQDLVVELTLGEPKIVTVNCPGDRVSITVTALDANHCPGSAMFLFEGYFGTIFYTGDFRYTPSMLEHPALNGTRTIDDLYLDNTYCDRQCHFPSREEATETIIKLIEDHLDRIILIGLHTLGKETMLVEVAMRLKTWIGVSKERYKALELLEMPDVFKTEMKECRLRVYQQYFITRAAAPEMKEGSEEDYLAILPTCLYTGRGAPPPPQKNPRLKIVEYSDHSCFHELREFVREVKPRRVHPIVRKFTGDGATIHVRCNMSVFDEFLDKTARTTSKIPLALKDLFSGQHVSLELTPVHPNLRRPLVGLRLTRQTPKGVQYISPKKRITQDPEHPPLTDREELVRELSKENTEERIAEMVSDLTTHEKEDNSTDLTGVCARMIPLSDIQLRKSQTRTYGPFVQTKLRFEAPTVPLEIKQEKEDVSEVVSDGVPPEMSGSPSRLPCLNTPTITMATAEVVSDGVPPEMSGSPSRLPCLNTPTITMATAEVVSDGVPPEMSGSPSRLPCLNTPIIPMAVVSDGVAPEMSGNPSRLPYLKTLTIPMVSVAKLRCVKDRQRVPKRCPDFLSDFPYEVIKRAALKHGCSTPLDHTHSSTLHHDWSTVHHIDENTKLCTCPEGKLCALSLVYRLDPLSGH